MKSKYLKSMMDVLNVALQRETEAFNYYYKSAQKAPMAETESLLIQLAEEERKHRYFVMQEMRKIQNLLSGDHQQDFLDDRHVAYALPENVDFKRVQGSPGLDFAAVSLPAELVGGDYFDTIRLDRESGVPAVGMYLYDVMGHGLKATHLKALVKRTFGQLREAWARGDSDIDMNQPAEVIRFINRDIVDVCVSCGHFITAFYTVIDPSRKKMLYTSAGHEPPLLIRAGGSCRHLDKTQLLMGVDKDVDYASVKASIHIDDVIVLFSDGITEAADAEQRMFEREGLRNSVKKNKQYAAKEIVYHVFQDLRDFLQGSPLTDDFTLAVMKVLKSK